MNIIEMARDAGLCDKEGRDDNSIIIEDHLERFAALVAAQEREACANICEEYDELRGYTPFNCALSIRARGTT